jgi:LPXTG-motif cell wall-anchored protein
MSADGNQLAIGAPFNDGNGDLAGHVRMYSWSGTAWTQIGADIDGEATGDWSGYSVAMSADGHRFATGAPSNDSNFSDAGHVRVYVEQNSPAAPTISSVTAADGSLAVSFIAGADGGSPITNYKYSIDGTNYIALNPATTTGPFTIGGLTNGTTYSVTIKAVNGVGDSPASNAITESPVAAAITVSGPSATVPASTTTVNNVGSLPETGSNSPILVIISALFVISGVTLIHRRRVFSN